MKKYLLTLLLTALTSNLYAMEKNALTAQHVQVEFNAVGKPSLLKIKGHGDEGSAQLNIEKNKVQGDVHFSLAALNSGIELRDKHMKEKYLDVGHYPEAILHLDSVQLAESWTLKKPDVDSGKFTGSLQLHGQTKPVSGTFEIKGKDLQTIANFDIKLSDFNIDIPSYLGIKVADVVAVHVEMQPHIN